MIATFTPKEKAQLLEQLSRACHDDGACNIRGIEHAKREAYQAIPLSEWNTHPAVRVIEGHLAFLRGEALGPTDDEVVNWREWLE